MTLLETIARQRTNEVVYTSVSLAIEKIATDAARELLSDPAFKAELKAAARQSIGRAVRDLRAANGRPRRKKASR
jgi:pantoate kinase